MDVPPEPWSAIKEISAESGATVNITVTINQGSVEEAIRLWMELAEARRQQGDTIANVVRGAILSFVLAIHGVGPAVAYAYDYETHVSPSCKKYGSLVCQAPERSAPDQAVFWQG
jgi:hypothetical protein